MKRLISLGMVVLLFYGCGSKENAKSETNSSSPSAQQSEALATIQKIAQAKKNPQLELQKQQLIKEGMVYLNKADISSALKAFGEVIKLDPSDTQAYFILVQTYMHLKNYDNALQILNTIIQIEPTNGLAYYLKGVASGLNGNNQEAMVSIKKSIEIFQAKKDEENLKRSIAFLQGLMENTSSVDDLRGSKSGNIKPTDVSVNMENNE